MKKVSEILECRKLINEMFEEWAKLPKVNGHDDYKGEKEIESKYLPKIKVAYENYKQEHPEEFKDEN